MFDMLDDDLDLGYVPTMMTNSRSGNMKKITKKQPKAQPKQPPTKPINNKSNDFDDLLDDLMDFQPKKANKVPQNKSVAPKQNMFNSLNSQFDQPKSTSLDKAKATSKQVSQPIASNTSKASFLKFDQTDQIIHEDHNISSFGKNQPPANNSIKNEEIFVSSRNMKPPINKKKSDMQSQSVSFGLGSMGLTIPDQNISKNLPPKNEDDEVIRPPPRLMNRKSSVDGRSEKNDQPLSLPKNNRSQSPINTFSFDKKEQAPKQRQQLRLSLDEPKVEPKIQKNEEVNSFKVKFAEKQKEVKPVEVEPPKPQKIIYKQQKPKKGLDMHIDQSITILKDSPGPLSHQANKIALEQYEKQIQQVKLTFQKQVDFLQQNLDRQIVSNRQTRDKLMRESNKMIEEERTRTKKIQEEEIRRLKEMFEWEKKRMQQSFQAEINNLRQSLEYAQKTSNYTFKTTSSSRQDIEYLENQLKNQKKLIDDRQRILEKRELQLSQRQSELNKRRKKQQDRLRQEQKRILQNEMKLKKQLLEQKRLLAEEKQQVAIQVANLEIQAMKKREKADYSLKENRMEKQGLQNQRFQLRNQNAELIIRYKVKVEEVQNQKIRLKQIEADLVKKLRIVQQRLKETSTTAVNKTMYTKKQNNWIEEKDKSYQHLRSFSIEKQNTANRPPTANQTKDRFYQLESNMKNKMNISVKENKNFDLDNYMMTVQEYKKMKGQA